MSFYKKEAIAKRSTDYSTLLANAGITEMKKFPKARREDFLHGWAYNVQAMREVQDKIGIKWGRIDLADIEAVISALVETGYLEVEQSDTDKDL